MKSIRRVHPFHQEVHPLLVGKGWLSSRSGGELRLGKERIDSTVLRVKVLQKEGEGGD